MGMRLEEEDQWMAELRGLAWQRGVQLRESEPWRACCEEGLTVVEAIKVLYPEEEKDDGR